MTELESLAHAGAAAVTAAERIYVDAFPVRQRERFASLLESIRDGEVLGWVQVENGAPIGIAVVLPLESLAWDFLEYFAIDGSIRSKGHGSALWAAMNQRPEIRRLIFEVEDPADAHDTEERTIRERRIAFYRRVGAELVEGVEYVVPDVQGTGDERLLLMWHDPDRVGLDRQTLAEVVTALYVEGYGLSPDHKLLSAALQSLDGRG
ncbi:GNAT family N-acetyltransferase [Kribbella sp. NPDC054772]